MKQNENKTLNDQTNDLLNANYAAKVEDNPNPSIAKYGCFTGSFKDGLQLSYSAYDIKPAIKSNFYQIKKHDFYVIFMRSFHFFKLIQLFK